MHYIEGKCAVIFAEKCLYKPKFVLNLPLVTVLAYGVTGNTSGFGPGESRFEP